LSIIIKKINNHFIFYDKDIEINIEESFFNGNFATDEALNVQWIHNRRWVKKHYFRKGLMSFLDDKYITKGIKDTRSYKEFFILNYLFKSGFNTCRPIIGWVTYGHIYYTANLVTEALPSITLMKVLQLNTMKDLYWEKIGIEVRKMHDLGIYHGDLNITNIMIDEKKGNIFILDFDKSHFRKIDESVGKSNLKRLKRSLLKNNFFNELDYKKIIDSYSFFKK